MANDIINAKSGPIKNGTMLKLGIKDKYPDLNKSAEALY